MTIHVIGAKYEGGDISLREVWVPLAELPVALGALSVWGEADDAEHNKLSRAIAQYPDQFPITKGAYIGILDNPDRKTAAKRDREILYHAQDPVMDVGLSKIRVQGRPVHGMAGRLEQGLGIAGLRAGSFDPMNKLNFAVYSPEECDQLLRSTPDFESARRELDLYPQRGYHLNEYGTWE